MEEMVSAVEMEREECDVGLSDLSVHVQECIFAKLPLHSILSSRSVCREWGGILNSHSFLSSLPVPLCNPWLLLWGEGFCMAYCFGMQKWITLSLSFLGDHHYDYDSPISVSTSAGRLFVQCSSQIYACNPLRRSYNLMQLGDLYSKEIELIEIVQEGPNGEPYLAVKTTYCIEIYHYFQDSWQLKFKLQQYTTDGRLDILHDEMVECNGVLFWSKCSADVVGFRIQDDSFSEVRIDEFPFLNLVEGKGYRPFIVAYGSSVLSVILVIRDKNMVISELFQDEEDEMLWKWRLLATTPADPVLDYYGITYERGWIDDPFTCACVGEYLCFDAWTDPPKIAAYNFRQGIWQFLPHLPDTNFVRMMTFQPSLIA